MRTYETILQFTGRAVRLRLPRQTLPFLQRVLSDASDAPAIAVLHQHAMQLTDALMQLRRRLRQVPPLPVGDDGAIRLLALAHPLLESGTFTAAALLRTLTDAKELTARERVAFPLCTATACAQQLHASLRALDADAHARQDAFRLSRQMPRMARPLAALERRALSGVFLASLLTALRQSNQAALCTAVEEWLLHRGTSAEDIATRSTQRQTLLADEIRMLAAALTDLLSLNWLPVCAKDDPLHRLFLTDPAGVYPRLTPASCAELRFSAEALAHRFRTTPQHVAQTVLTLCQDAAPRSLESHVGYWLLDPKGTQTLRQTLGTRRGRLLLTLHEHRDTLYRSILLVLAIVTSLMYLHAFHPTLLLPFFLLLTGRISRVALRLAAPSVRHPAIAVSRISPELRTLVVLPAVLHDTSEAIAMVRHLKTAQHAFPRGVDLLLLGDYAPAPAPHLPEDAAIREAAITSVNALNDASGPHFLYMQRSRVWDAAQQAFSARGGRLGALESVCRMIAQGTCEDLLEAATSDPSQLHRRYAFVLSLTPDVRPTPGMLEALLSVMAHPLCTRFPLPTGNRGYSILQPRRVMVPQSGTALRALTDIVDGAGFAGVGLIRPDAYLLSTDGMLSANSSFALAGVLAGCLDVPTAAVHQSPPTTLLQRMTHHFRATQAAWRSLPWLMPWVQTPAGLLHTPLSRADRFHLREAMREGLIPLAQVVMLVYALVRRDVPLLLLALLGPELSLLWPLNRRVGMRLLARTVLLPTRAAVRLLGIYEALRGLLPQPYRGKARTEYPWATLEVWVQGIAATIMLSLAIAPPTMWGPTLILGGLFGCFALVHARLDAPAAAPEPLSADETTQLTDAFRSGWQFFADHVTAATHHLPPCAVQTDPPCPPEDATSPEAIAMYLLSCVSAKETGVLSVTEACERLEQALAGLRELPMPLGLPCRRYQLSTLTVADPTVSSDACGLLLAALTTCAQALRSWLPASPARQHGLSALLSSFAGTLHIDRLYDAEQHLFFTGLDADGQPEGVSPWYADERLLLSMTVCARGLVPASHMAHLADTWVRLGNDLLPLSRHGDACASLLPGLFLPLDADGVVRLQQMHGMEGVFGQSDCAVWRFTPEMAYQRATLGLSEMAVQPTAHLTVYAAYAAALCLPYAPRASARCLERMKNLGAWGAYGLTEAIDLRYRGAHGELTPRPVGLYDAYHQGILLCSLAHVLADAPVRRYFCALPEVEATLPLLHRPLAKRLILPGNLRPMQEGVCDTPPALTRRATPHTRIPDAHLIGNAGCLLGIDANGNGFMRCDGVPLTREDLRYGALSGMQCYLADDGRVYRVMDAELPGDTTYGAGFARFERRCGSLRAVLTVSVDPVRRCMLHELAVTNLSTADRTIEVTDCLLPDLATGPDTLAAARPDPLHLTLRDRATGRTLHHTMTASALPILTAVCTDEGAFLGRGRTLHAPASLEEPMSDLMHIAQRPCLSFRAQFLLGGRGQVTLLYATGLTDTPAPEVSAFEGLLALSEMQDRALVQSVPLTATQEMAAACMTGALLWTKHDAAPYVLVLMDTEEGMPLFTDALAAAACFRLRGVPVEVYAVYPEDMHDELTPYAEHATLLESPAEETQSALTARACIILREGAGTLLHQVQGLSSMPLHVSMGSMQGKQPVPAGLPKETLSYASGYGGFDPETGDYLICLTPGQTTPAPWPNIHQSRLFREVVDESGFRGPFHELVRLVQEDGTVIDPFMPELPRVVRQGAGYTEWQCYTDTLDVSLSACCMPGYPAGLRILRIANATERACTLKISIAAELVDGPSDVLSLTEDAVLCHRPAHPRGTCLTGLSDGWTAGLCTVLTDSAGRRHLLSDPTGSTAELTCTLTVAAQSHTEAVWLCGHVEHAEQVVQAQTTLQTEGSSALLRHIRTSYGHALDELTIATPEETLDILMNRLLPLQCRTTSEALPDIAPMLAVTSPQRAEAHLLHCAAHATDPLRLAWATALTLRITGNEQVLDRPLPKGNGTLRTYCTAAFSSLALDERTLPRGTNPAATAFRIAATARGWMEQAPDTTLSDLANRLCNAADTYLWTGMHYGSDEVTLSAQVWAVLADGANARTKQGMSSAWAQLYDQEHGALRARLPEETHVARPGTPSNGGQDTHTAALALTALAHLGHIEQAWELLRALNPIHHADTPLRTEEHQAAPYRLHGGMDASPALAGRASRDGTAAAGWLYLTILEDLLGFRRRGDMVTLTPHVPPDWDAYTLTLRHGASTWHFSLERGLPAPTLDGEPLPGPSVTLHDDGKVHQVRTALNEV